jgi:hypothetical protein
MQKLTITEMKKRNQEQGQKFFSKGAMDFFNTTIEARPDKNNIFITSEFMDDPENKRYSLRRFDTETDKVETVGEFQEYGTLEEARQARKEK